MNFDQFNYSKTFELEQGGYFSNLIITYSTFGKLNREKNNVVWVCHALTGNSNVLEWWTGLFGENDFFNPKEYFIICANVIGSSYSGTNPLSINHQTDKPYFLDFPLITVKDMARAHFLLAEYLGIQEIETLIGGSLGGQQALEFALIDKLKINNMILLCTNAKQSPWAIAFNESQRLAIEADHTFRNGIKDGGLNGLKVARSIALLSYRTALIYNETQVETEKYKLDNYKASSYQDYHGNKFIKRFDAYSYWYLTKAMDTHDIARNKNSSIEKILGSIKIKTLVLGIKSDLLFPIEEQKLIAESIPDSGFEIINSKYGHDGFLIETEKISKQIIKFFGSE